MPKRTADEISFPDPARVVTSSRLFDPHAGRISAAQARAATRLDPVEEREKRECAGAPPKEVDIWLFEENLEAAIAENTRDAEHRVDIRVPHARFGVGHPALADLSPATRDVLRRNKYIVALIRTLRTDEWMRTEAALKSHIVSTGVEIEGVDDAGRWICTPALSEERHAYDGVEKSQVELEREAAVNARAQEIDADYMLAQMASIKRDMSFAEDERLRVLIQDALQIVIAVEREEGRGLRIVEWRVEVA